MWSWLGEIMSSINKVILIGNLGADPEVKQLPGGDTVCNLRLATTDKWTDKVSGDSKEATEWHRVVLFRRLGEIAGQYLKKGSLVYIEGQLKTRKWQDRDGHDRYTTEIEASVMQMLGSRSAGNSDVQQSPNFSARMPPPTKYSDADYGDVPF